MSILAVHGGACTKKIDTLLSVCEQSVAEKTVLDAVKILEKDENFNCGYGSNLTINGNVECEASYSSSKDSKFGAVGCVSHFLHPSELAFTLANDNWWKDRNLLHPLLLVGEGAEEYGETKGLCRVENDELVCAKSKKQFEKCREYLENIKLINSHDTVGAVSFNLDFDKFEAEAMTSSGGIIMKNKGRLGHSCMYGSGNWTDVKTLSDGTQKLISICSTGHGEALIRSDFCRGISRRILDDEEDNMNIEIIRDYLQSSFSPKSAIFGAILLFAEKYENTTITELLIFHNCRFLPVAVRHKNGKIQKFMSKLEKGSPFCIKSIPLQFS